jgi:hypothetical protein
MYSWANFVDFPAPAGFIFWNLRFLRLVFDFVPVVACFISLFLVDVIVFGLTFQILF